MEEEGRCQHHRPISEVKASWWEALQLQAYLRDKAECAEHDQDEGDEEEEGEVDEDDNFEGSELESTDSKNYFIFYTFGSMATRVKHVLCLPLLVEHDTRYKYNIVS